MMAARSTISWTDGLNLLLLAFIFALSSCPFTGVDGACGLSEFQCVYQNRCIASTKQFNGVNDCYDNSDESHGKWCEKVNSVRCATSGSCIPIAYRNDGQSDCADSSDEAKVVGSYCNVSQCCPCRMFIGNSYCNQAVSKCACTDGHYPSTLLNNCIARVIGDSCTVDVDCSAAVSHSSCLNSVCGCDNGYYMTNNNTVCTARVLGDGCTAKTDCSGAMVGSDCISGSCECTADWFDYTNRTTCWHLHLGDVCTRDSLCYAGIAHAYCKSGVCDCVAGYIWERNMNDVCRNRLIGVDRCDATSDCGVANSVCAGVGSVCLCTTEYSVTADRYQCTVRGVNESCTGNDQCAGLAHAFCSDDGGTSRCACSTGYKPSATLQTCLNKAVGDPCITDADCSDGFLGGYCTVSKVCGCRDGFFTNTNSNNITTCRRLVLGSDSCTTDSDCSPAVPNSLCAPNNTCICGPGYETTSDYYFCLDPSAATQACNDLASCKPWAIALIIIALLLPPVITVVVMFIYKKIQERKARLSNAKREKYGKSDLYRELGMAAIPTITNFTAPYDTALHRLPEIDYTSTPKGAVGLVIRDQSFFRDITSITSKGDLMTKVEL